jgi:two-component system response regulator HydG
MSPNLKILIVDDDHRMTRTLADILTISGFEAVEVGSGREALDMIALQKFDCVLTDVKMPEMDGVELHRLIHQTQPGLPVILMTAYAAEELIRQGLDDGIVGVFDKPLVMNHLLGFFASLAKNRTIVVVDNDPNFCHTLDDILRQRGFNVCSITDPLTEIESMVSEAQIIMLDIHLNQINGLDVLREIRKRYPILPVLLVTGYGNEMASAIQSAQALNIYACLYKPLEIPQLLELLSKVQLEFLRRLLKS